MDHDTLQNGCDRRKYIMAESLGIGQVTWSTCSANIIAAYIRSPQFSCLFQSNNRRSYAMELGRTNNQNENESSNVFTNRILPGLLYNINEQCKSFNGPNSSHDSRQSLETVCQFVQCTNIISRFYRFPALEGTICGPGKWCKGGICVSQTNISLKFRQEHGWSFWYLSVPCTSLCLQNSIGIEEFRRTCHSSIDTQSEDCTGESIYYNICPSSLCPINRTSLKHYISSKCSNNTLFHNTFVFSGIGHQKHYRKENKAESCRIYCDYNILGKTDINTSRKSIIKGILPTGTLCNSNPIMYCIKGICQSVNTKDPFTQNKML
ncbi:unnamed protein product [Gordionus sp. m RMFG-2023]